MRWLAWLAATFMLHLGWELSQARWFATMSGLPFRQGLWICIRASLGDVVITLIAFAAAAAVARGLHWPLALHAAPLVTYMAAGVAITAAYEIFALRTGRWEYAAQMPTLFGIGALPLLQWTIIPPLGLLIFRTMWRNRRKTS